MIRRCAEKVLTRWAREYPVIGILGPRQSGKTTLARMTFPKLDYVSLEDIDNRLFAKDDPRGFLDRYSNGAIIDEVQYVPELFSYIQTMVDSRGKTGMFVLTGSHQFNVVKGMKQSLAGRIALLNLLPFSFSEIKKHCGRLRLEEVLFTGFYPRIFDKGLTPTEFYSFYVATYLEKDVKDIISIKNMREFNVFLKLCAGRSGQVLNLSSLAVDCGVSHNTIRSWISVLEASFIIRLLYPYYNNFGKRFVKSPKLYFLDPGLLCYLLGIKRYQDLENHYLRGAIFESFVFSEILKGFFNSGQQVEIYYLRDVKGYEVDFVIDKGSELDLIEVKSAKTIASLEIFRNIEFFRKISKRKGKSFVIYSGSQKISRKDVLVLPWNEMLGEIRI